MPDHPVATREQWLAARTDLFAREKELTRRADELARARRALPWVAVDKPYVFETPHGPKSLGELFRGKSQLFVYHFMFGPQAEHGCPSCSMVADHIDRSAVHLANRDVQVVLASRAPVEKLQAFERRMGWTLPWVSVGDGEFARDYGVRAGGGALYNYGTEPFRGDDVHGASVFHREPNGDVFHTYSSYGRGVEPLLGVYSILDMMPDGRAEDGLPWPMAWIEHHDRYAQP